MSFKTGRWQNGVAAATGKGSYAGSHNIASNNIITRECDGSSHHSYSNGIILDLGSNTPPALTINNVLYGSGGRCIDANGVANFGIINNTCYKNELDTSRLKVGSFTSQNSSDGYFVNNLTKAGKAIIRRTTRRAQTATSITTPTCTTAQPTTSLTRIGCS